MISVPYRILHIDDDVMMQKIYRERLGAEGCSMRAAATGQEGIDAATQEKFDVILLDHVLPDMTSTEVLGVLREKGVLAYSKVVVLTASGQESDAEKARASGASAFFSKDKVSPRDMLSELTKIVGVRAEAPPQSAVGEVESEIASRPEMQVLVPSNDVPLVLPGGEKSEIPDAGAPAMPFQGEFTEDNPSTL